MDTVIVYVGDSDMTCDGDVMPYDINVCSLLSLRKNTIMWTDSTKTAVKVVNDLHFQGYALSNKGVKTFDVTRGINGHVYRISVRPTGKVTLRIYNVENILPHTGQTELFETFGGTCRLDMYTRIADKLMELGIHSPTAGSAAMAEYRDMYGYGEYFRRFPKSDIWTSDMRQAYHGGIVYAKPGEWHDGVSYDCNSMYPDAARNNAMPHGLPEHYDGAYEDDGKMPYHLDRLTFRAHVKEGCIPYAGMLFGSRDEMSEDTGGYITRWITDIDMATLREYYEVRVVEEIEGYKFSVRKGMFSLYVDEWYRRKSKDREGKRAMDKMMLNSFIGKFGSFGENGKLMPEWGDDDAPATWGVVKDDDNRTVSYPPVAMWATSFARRKLLRAMHANIGHLVYADTDSIILDTTEDPNGIEVNDNKLGAWKIERRFKDMRVLGVRRYAMRLTDGTTVNNLAGTPMNHIIDYEDFRPGSVQRNGAGGEFVL